MPDTTTPPAGPTRDNPTSSAEPAGAETSEERTFTSREVEAIVRDRLARLKKEKRESRPESPGPAPSSQPPDVDLESLKATHATELTAVAEASAAAAVEAVAKRLEQEFTAHKAKLEAEFNAQMADVMEASGLTLEDIRHLRRMKRLSEKASVRRGVIDVPIWKDRR